MLEPGGHEAVTSMFGEELLDGSLVGLGRGRRKGERNFAETEFEHPVAAAGLAVIVALGRRPAQKLDLAVVEAEAAVDRRDLRLDRPLVRQQQPRRTAFDDRRRDRGAVDVRKRLGGEDDGRVLLAKRLQPFAELAGEILVVEGEPTFIDDEKRRPAIETVLRCDERGRPARPGPRWFRSTLRSRTPGPRPRQGARIRHRAGARTDRPGNRVAGPASGSWIAAGPTGPSACVPPSAPKRETSAPTTDDP